MRRYTRIFKKAVYWFKILKTALAAKSTKKIERSKVPRNT